MTLSLIFNDFYVKIVQRITGIAPKHDIDPDTSMTEIVSKIVNRYKKYSSVISIMTNFRSSKFQQKKFYLNIHLAIGNDNIPPKNVEIGRMYTMYTFNYHHKFKCK